MPAITVRAVLFDLDRTLCQYNVSGPEILSAAFSDAGVDPFFTAEEYYAKLHEFVDHEQEPAVWREQAFAALAGQKGFAPEQGRQVANAYAELRDHTDVSCLPGAREALESLEQSYFLGLITNGHPSTQRLKLEALSLHSYFETIVFAGYDTSIKPDPAPFERAISSLDVKPEAALVVGDSLESDIAGAKDLGMHTAWVANGRSIGPDDPQPDYVIDTLDELAEEPWREEEPLQ